MKVVVVGAGLAGLFTASRLTQRGIEDVVILDRAERPGGVMRTLQRRGFTLEPAAGSFTLPHPHLSPVFDRAGVETMPAPQASARYIFAAGRLVSIPASPKALLTPALGIGSKLRALLEPIVPSRPDDDESLADFARRRFGEKTGELAASLMASGVFAGDAERLSAKAAFPALAELERTDGSVIRGAARRRRAQAPGQERRGTHVPVNGMSGVVDSIVRALGNRFHPSFTVESLQREGHRWIVAGSEQITTDVVVLAVSPHVAASLVEDELAHVLRRSVAAPVAVVFLGGTGATPLPNGFGVLVGPEESLSARGILFESSYASFRAPEGSWLTKVIVGGATARSVVDWDDQRLISTVIAEVETVLGTELSPDLVEVVRHRPGIPQYEIGHHRWLTEIDRQLAATPGLYLTGWGYRGIGVPHLATDAARLAEELDPEGPSEHPIG